MSDCGCSNDFSCNDTAVDCSTLTDSGTTYTDVAKQVPSSIPNYYLVPPTLFPQVKDGSLFESNDSSEMRDIAKKSRMRTFKQRCCHSGMACYIIFTVIMTIIIFILCVVGALMFFHDVIKDLSKP